MAAGEERRGVRAKMNHNSENATVVCPYYSSHDKTIIKCQGIAGTARTGLIFYSSGQREKYMRNFCDGFSYGDCPLAWIHEE